MSATGCMRFSKQTVVCAATFLAFSGASSAEKKYGDDPHLDRSYASRCKTETREADRLGQAYTNTENLIKYCEWGALGGELEAMDALITAYAGLDTRRPVDYAKAIMWAEKCANHSGASAEDKKQCRSAVDELTRRFENQKIKEERLAVLEAERAARMKAHETERAARETERAAREKAAQEEANAKLAREKATRETPQEKLKDVYKNYISMQSCYESRREYARQYVSRGDLDRARSITKRDEEKLVRAHSELAKQKDKIWETAKSEFTGSMLGVWTRAGAGAYINDAALLCGLIKLGYASESTEQGNRIKKDF